MIYAPPASAWQRINIPAGEFSVQDRTAGWFGILIRHPKLVNISGKRSEDANLGPTVP